MIKRKFSWTKSLSKLCMSALLSTASTEPWRLLTQRAMSVCASALEADPPSVMSRRGMKMASRRSVGSGPSTEISSMHVIMISRTYDSMILNVSYFSIGNVL